MGIGEGWNIKVSESCDWVGIWGYIGKRKEYHGAGVTVGMANNMERKNVILAEDSHLKN